jgi:hypothetical protein
MRKPALEMKLMMSVITDGDREFRRKITFGEM